MTYMASSWLIQSLMSKVCQSVFSKSKLAYSSLIFVDDQPTSICLLTQQQLEGKYSLESTDPRESKIRAHLRP